MNPTDIAQQTLVENNMLSLITEGLRNTLAWQVKGDNFSRKLTTLRFITQSLERHLEHLFALEEVDGYMDHVLRTAPQLAKTVDALKQDHEHFRGVVRRIVHRLERISPTDRLGFNDLCDDLTGQLDKLDEHHRKEVDLLQEALEREEGGEG
jgi:hypothetical protein